MTVTAWTLYRFKVAMFTSALRRQPAGAAAFLVLAILILPGAFAMGYFLPESPFASADLVETFALPLSIVAALGLLAAPGGGMLLQPAEVDFVAVAPVSVRRFALADALFQCTVFGASLPVIGIGVLGYTLRAGVPLWAALVPVGMYALSLFLFTLFVQALGIARLFQRPWVLPVTAGLFVALIAPAIARSALRLPAAYSNLPYPTTAAVQVALLPFGSGGWTGVPIFAAFALLAVAANRWATREPSLPNLRGTFAFSFTPEAKRTQQEALLRAFGHLRRAEGARLHRPSLVRTMAVLHFVRMTRDGTLFLSAILALAIGLPSAFSAAPFSFGGFYVSMFLAVAAVAQWMATDRTNNWIVRVSGVPPEAFYVGWWASLAALATGIGIAIALVAGVVLGSIDGVGIAATVAGSLGAVAGSVVAAARWPYVPNEFSMRPILHMTVTGVLGGVFVVPIIAAAFALTGSPGAAAVIATSVAVAGAVSFTLVRSATRNPAL